MATSPNPPSKHHFLPEFLLKEWVGPDGKFERFVLTPAGDLHRKRVGPNAIGYKKDLYKVPATPEPWAAQELETNVFAPIDDRSARTLRKMKAGQLLDSDDRSAWATLLMAFFHRSPSYFAATKEVMQNALLEEDLGIEEEYAKRRGPDDPPTFKEWLQKRDPAEIERIAHKSVPNLITNESIGTFLVQSPWQLLNLSAAKNDLLLSDHPLVFRPLKLEGGHMAMPVGPKRLFITSRDRNLLNQLGHLPADDIVAKSNEFVVNNASELVIATDHTQSEFIKTNFGVNRIGSLAKGFEL